MTKISLKDLTKLSKICHSPKSLRLILVILLNRWNLESMFFFCKKEEENELKKGDG